VLSVVDFTSALYLGFRHANRELRPWTQFTTGMPAALESPEIAKQVAQGLAQLQGCESGTLAASTLHVFWDLFGTIGDSSSAIYIDRGTYPIASWGAERIAARGAPVHFFGHHDARALRRGLAAGASGRRPVILADGFCPNCGKCAPIEQYLDLAREYGGYLVLDDTQALGIFGRSPSSEAPYGKGGGGMLRRAQVRGPEVIVVSSLAKAFGVPVAILSGSSEVVERFESLGETRMHCSPPSIATLRAAENALRRNKVEGDSVRLRLAQLVYFFRNRIENIGLTAAENIFPVQTISPTPGLDIFAVHAQLTQQGIRCLLHRSRHDRTPALSFLITARHTFEELGRTVGTLYRILRPLLRPTFISR
jgi:8-amino-7-oxononanoate synthase